MGVETRSRLRIWSRETSSAVSSRVSLLISILRPNLVLTYGIPPEFRGGVLYPIDRYSAESSADHATYDQQSTHFTFLFICIQHVRRMFSRKRMLSYNKSSISSLKFNVGVYLPKVSLKMGTVPIDHV